MSGICLDAWQGHLHQPLERLWAVDTRSCVSCSMLAICDSCVTLTRKVALALVTLEVECLIPNGELGVWSVSTCMIIERRRFPHLWSPGILLVVYEHGRG